MQQFDSGDDLKTARITLALSQNDMALALGVSVATLRRHEASAQLDLLIGLAAECLLRRAQFGGAAVSPEERAERRFREAKRLRELKEAAGMVRKPYEPMPVRAVVARRQAIRKLEAVTKRNIKRDQQRPVVLQVHKGLPPIEGDTVMEFIDANAGGRVNRVLRNRADYLARARQEAQEFGWLHIIAYCNAADQRQIADDDPLVTLPLEPEE